MSVAEIKADSPMPRLPNHVNQQLKRVSLMNEMEVYQIDCKSAVALTVNADKVWREEVDQAPQSIEEGYEYMPWGADNQMPYEVVNLIEQDETLTTCMQFNAEICYGGGFNYDCSNASVDVLKKVDDFVRHNNMSGYYYGICQDLKYFGFAISVVYLNANKGIVRVVRKHAAYCRFAPADSKGRIPYILYGNWRKSGLTKADYEKIPLLDSDFPVDDFFVTIGKQIGDDGKTKVRTESTKFAVLTKIPCADSMYYPIPPYAALFRGKWYNIKNLIGVAKEANLKNSAPIKYLVEISDRYFERIFKAAGITDNAKKKERIKREKGKIIGYLTGAENSGKALFANFYVSPDGKEVHDVKITRIDEDSKQGGDWATDMVEAINMICFAMRVHSNLVGSVPSKSQTNNSGSDKRELYTIAQALQKPYHDLVSLVHNLIIVVNKWDGVKPNFPFIQLTTLDENKDAKEVTLDKNNKKE